MMSLYCCCFPFTVIIAKVKGQLEFTEEKYVGDYKELTSQKSKKFIKAFTDQVSDHSNQCIYWTRYKTYSE